MSDFLDDYRKRVRGHLSSSEVDPPSCSTEVLCLPSFHPETLLRVTATPSGTTFRLLTFTASLWYSQYSEGGKKPERLEEAVHVPQVQADRFWRSVDELNPKMIRDQSSIGLDGISIVASWNSGEAAVSFEAWSPSPESRPGRFLGLIYDLGWQVVKEHVSIERLEQLHGYLRAGLPVRMVKGAVKCLRIFGSLSSTEETALRSLFSSLLNDDPIIVDMTNFDGMGTLLHPAFVEFSSSRPQLVWAASGSVSRLIESLGLVHSQVFDRTEDAVEWLAQRPRPHSSVPAFPE